MTTKTKKVEVIEESAVPEGQEYKSAAKVFRAYADFEFRIGSQPPVEVKAGEIFTPPHGWTRNLAQEELLLTSKRKNDNNPQIGVVFTYLGDFVNPHEKVIELRERRVHNAILPLEEV